MTYDEKLRDPRWQQKQLKIFERDSCTCQSCGATNLDLEIYDRAHRDCGDPWNYPDSELITVCNECHEEIRNCVEAILPKLDDREYRASMDALRFAMREHPEVDWRSAIVAIWARPVFATSILVAALALLRAIAVKDRELVAPLIDSVNDGGISLSRFVGWFYSKYQLSMSLSPEEVAHIEPAMVRKVAREWDKLWPEIRRYCADPCNKA